MTREDSIALKEEADNLGLHVQMCAMRHEQILRRLEASEGTAVAWRARVEKAIWAILGVLCTGLGAGATQALPLLRQFGIGQ